MVTFITIRLSHAEISAVFKLGFISEPFSTKCWGLGCECKIAAFVPGAREVGHPKFTPDYVRKS